jgi:hypothetical protein
MMLTHESSMPAHAQQRRPRGLAPAGLSEGTYTVQAAPRTGLLAALLGCDSHLTARPECSSTRPLIRRRSISSPRLQHWHITPVRCHAPHTIGGTTAHVHAAAH